MAEIINHRLVHPTEGHRMNRVYVEGKGWYGWNTAHHVYNAVQNYEQMTTDDLKAVDYQRADDDGRRPRPPHTVFLACLHFDYEGFEIVGVYRTYEAASEALSRVISTGRTFDRTSIDEYTVEE